MPKLLTSRTLTIHRVHGDLNRQDYTESVEAIGRALKELKAKSKVQRAWWKELAISGTLPKFNSSPLKNDGWKTILSFWGPVHFQGLCLTSGVYFSVLSKNASDHWDHLHPKHFLSGQYIIRVNQIAFWLSFFSQFRNKHPTI